MGRRNRAVCLCRQGAAEGHAVGISPIASEKSIEYTRAIPRVGPGRGERLRHSAGRSGGYVGRADTPSLNTESGWANVHPLLAAHGWVYRCCNVRDKGFGHIAGNANTRTPRKFPVVTEVCVHYVKAARFRVADGVLAMQEWLRHEWKRTKLPLRLAPAAPSRESLDGWEHSRLHRDVREAIVCMPMYFRTETNISGIMATRIRSTPAIIGEFERLPDLTAADE